MNQPWGTPPQQPQPGGYGQPGGHQWAGYAPAGQGQVLVDIKHHPLAFIYSFRSPVITLNGQRVRGSWGPNALPLPPGHHQLGVHVPYLLPPEVGHAWATVPVQPGAQVHLEYRAPMVAFMGGALGAPPQKWPGIAAMYVVFGLTFVLMILLVFVAFIGAVSA